jgi:hypothetical protein
MGSIRVHSGSGTRTGASWGRVTSGACPPTTRPRRLSGFLRALAKASLAAGRSSGPGIAFILTADPLLEWDGWNVGTKAWIADHGTYIPIVDVIDTYARVANEFDLWLTDRISVKYRADIEASRRVPGTPVAGQPPEPLPAL